MNKTLLIRQTEVNAEKYAKELYEADITVSINKETLKITVKPKNKGSVKKEIKDFIINYCNEELAPLKTKSVDDSVVIADDTVVMATNNNNNDIVSAIKEVIEVTKPEKKKKWDDIPDSELNKGLMVEYGDDIVPVVSLYGEGSELAGVTLSMKDNTNYFWSYYGDIVYMKREHIHEMYNSSRKMKYYVKHLDDKIILIYNLKDHYEDLEKISDINYIMSLSPSAVKELCKDLDADRVCDIRDKVVVYLKQHRRIMPYNDVIEYCEALEIEEYMLD